MNVNSCTKRNFLFVNYYGKPIYDYVRDLLKKQVENSKS